MRTWCNIFETFDGLYQFHVFTREHTFSAGVLGGQKKVPVTLELGF